MAGFCESASSLRATKPAAVGAKSPIVSGRYLKYSRFRETGAGDRIRSALRRRACSATGQILRLGRRQNGNVEPALRHGAHSESRQLSNFHACKLAIPTGLAWCTVTYALSAAAYDAEFGIYGGGASNGNRPNWPLVGSPVNTSTWASERMFAGRSTFSTTII
jgi:hypothetical protein